jgi:hypothetical protein
VRDITNSRAQSASRSPLDQDNGLRLCWLAGGEPVLRVLGDLEAQAGERVLPAGQLILRLRPARLTLDLSATGRLDEQAMRCLVGLGEQAHADAVPLRILTGPPTARVLLAAAARGDLAGVELSQTSNNLIDARTGAEHLAGDVEPEELRRLREQVADLRTAIRTRPLIAEALGVLRERYRLTNGGAAFDLLRRASQRHHIKVRTLACAVLAVAPPERADRWFPARIRQPAPRLDLIPPGRTIDRALVLETALRAALAGADSDHGELHVVDPYRGGLELETARGLSRDYLDHTAQIGADQGCLVARVLRERAAVRVPDLAHEPSLTDGHGLALLVAQGIRAALGVPLIAAAPSGDARVLGVVAMYQRFTAPVLTEEELGTLNRIAGQTAAWLDWHHRTVVLDALEHLHAHAAR